MCVSVNVSLYFCMNSVSYSLQCLLVLIPICSLAHALLNTHYEPWLSREILLWWLAANNARYVNIVRFTEAYNLILGQQLDACHGYCSANHLITQMHTWNCSQPISGYMFTRTVIIIIIIITSLYIRLTEGFSPRIKCQGSSFILQHSS